LATQALGTSHRSLSEQIYENLRERIINGELAPGARLLERELAIEMQVSRIPLREALPQLEANGFIRTIPRRGAVVTQLTVRDVEELFDVRLALEVLAARLAAQNATKSGLVDLERALRRAERATLGNSPKVITAANAAFHECIIELSGSELLQRLMHPINGRVRWLFRLTSDRDAMALCKEHQALFQAVEARDQERAASIAAAHVESGRGYSLAAVRRVLPDDRDTL
jgi:DNA-binding GntR family transcriptional regulator